MKIANNTFPVRQGVSADYLANILTKDITAIESIFELVDNAVDAARDRLFEQGNSELDEYGLPSRYDGNWIGIRFGRESVSFLDNCSGIAEEALVDRAFVIGAMSHHLYGIGRFGIGLKRALFRLGTTYVFSTDTGTFAAKMRFDSTHLGQADSMLVATRCVSVGRAKTFVHIAGLREGVLHEFGAASWVNDLSKSLSRRYGLLIAKGFKILVNGIRVPCFGPRFRIPGPVKVKASNFPATEHVRVFIDSGMHEEYRLKSEPDYNTPKAVELTDQYGWYFVCNDRIVEVAKHEPKLGWRARWHQEYYGFVGWVRFIASDAGYLPWDTKKSLIDPNSLVFRAISGQLQEFAEDYKRQNKRAKKKALENPGQVSGSAIPGAPKIPEKGTSTTPVKSLAATSAIMTAPNGLADSDHNENWDTLLPALEIGLEDMKLKALIVEASQLKVKNCYSASMLFRSVVEKALFEHLKLTRSYGPVRQMVFDEAAKDKKAFSEDQKRTFRPTFNQALEWLGKNDDYFPDEMRRDCIFARNKFSKHLRELNGIVHEGDFTNSGKLEIMRNDTMPLLCFLLRIKVMNETHLANANVVVPKRNNVALLGAESLGATV